MITNINQALVTLRNFLKFQFGKPITILLDHAENVKYHESNFDEGKRKFVLGRLTTVLINEFDLLQSDIDKLTKALTNSLEHFQYQIVKMLYESRAIPDQFKDIDDEIVRISKELQEEPYNYHSVDFENRLKIGIVFNLLHDLGQPEFADLWGELAERNDPPHLKDGDESVYDEYVEVFLDEWKTLYDKFANEPDLPLYILNIIYTLRFHQNENQ